MNSGDYHRREVARLRAEQAAAVMPLIGPLLDAWEQVPTDLRDELSDLAGIIAEIDAAMEGDADPLDEETP